MANEQAIIARIQEAPMMPKLPVNMLLANVALPSFVGHWIVFIILLPLVATIEAVVLARLLGVKPIESLVTSAKANWRSTIAGLPAGWCMALAGLIPAGILAYFLPSPYRDPAFQIIAFTALTGGIIPTRFSMIAMAAACLLLLVPYYVATVRVERKVVQARHPDIDPERVAVAVRWANRLSYSVLALLVLWWLMTAIADYRQRPENSDHKPQQSIASISLYCVSGKQCRFAFSGGGSLPEARQAARQLDGGELRRARPA